MAEVLSDMPCLEVDILNISCLWLPHLMLCSCPNPTGDKLFYPCEASRCFVPIIIDAVCPSSGAGAVV